MVVDRAADVGDQSLAEPGDEIEAPEGRRRQDHDDDQEGQEILVDEVGLVAETVIDHPADRLADHQHRAGGDDQRGDGARDHLEIGSNEG